MLLEFDDGWQLHTHKAFSKGRIFWFTMNHTHPTHHDGGGTWQEINIMSYHVKQKCPECGNSPPDALHGYVSFIEWSINNAD